MPRRDDKKLSTLTRRDFTRAIAVTAVTVAVPHETPANVPDSTQDAAAKALPPAGEAQLQTILAKYGTRLSDEQKADARRLVAQAQKASEALRSFPLDNSDEPAMIFHMPKSQDWHWNFLYFSCTSPPHFGQRADRVAKSPGIVSLS